MVLKLDGYAAFDGRHWETGSVCNDLAYRQVKAPHTGQPYSEALLLGVSGGIVFGYFHFAYQGYDPHLALLTRNTFDPLETLLARLGVPQNVRQTASPTTAVKNLTDALEAGLPALTWVDIFSLPYLELPNTSEMALSLPVLVYGYDYSWDTAWIADRSIVPLIVKIDQLETARAKIKRERYRVMTLGNPDPEKLPGAVQAGIQDTIDLFTKHPPKGAARNFGFAAYRAWCEALRGTKAKNSWAALFPPGRPMLAGLLSAYASLLMNGESDDAERGVYADFLDEASLILQQPALKEAAGLFRQAGEAWRALGQALLPDEVQPLGELRRLMLDRRYRFIHQGMISVPTTGAINQQITALTSQAAQQFPLTGPALEAFKERLCERIMQVHDLETQAVQAMQG